MLACVYNKVFPRLGPVNKERMTFGEVESNERSLVNEVQITGEGVNINGIETLATAHHTAPPLPTTTTEPPTYPVPPTPCNCEMSERLKRDRLVIKEATTGYTLNGGQEIGTFVTYVIEFGVL